MRSMNFRLADHFKLSDARKHSHGKLTIRGRTVQLLQF